VPGWFDSQVLQGCLLIRCIRTGMVWMPARTCAVLLGQSIPSGLLRRRL
jgi:hypothetical protein